MLIFIIWKKNTKSEYDKFMYQIFYFNYINYTNLFIKSYELVYTKFYCNFTQNLFVYYLFNIYHMPLFYIFYIFSLAYIYFIYLHIDLYSL